MENLQLKSTGVYLASHIAEHKDFNIHYQDITGKRDIGGCMLDVDLNNYDFIIATPPCNYWSRANYRRDTSEYSLKTKHLLPDILTKLKEAEIPYIVENVKNSSLFTQYNLYDLAPYVYEIGRHTYWTNIPFNMSNKKFAHDNIKNKSSKNRQGGQQVYDVIQFWLEYIKEMGFIND